MSKLDEALNEQFQRWELRGRGGQVFGQPVAIEPPFCPFQGYSFPKQVPRDDGRRHSAASGFLASLRQQLLVPPAAQHPPEMPEPEPEFREAGDVVELQLSLPLSRPVPTPQVEQFLRHACRPGEPLALEILGTGRETVLQFVASPRAATRVRSAVGTCFPGVVCAPSGGSDNSGEALREAWHDSESNFAVVELGLAREFMLPLGDPRCDLLASVAAAVDVLEEGELALLQILFEPAQAPWPENIARLVINPAGKPVFVDRPDFVTGMEEKLASPLFGVVVRLASSAADLERAWEIIEDMAAPLSALMQPDGNFFAPLANDDYPQPDHEQDILNRQSRRSGMLLSMEELTSLIAPPVTSAARRLRREMKGTNPPPEIVLTGDGLLLGTNAQPGATREVYLSPEHRVRHTHVIGASGTGKSTLLLNLIEQDIERGEGLAVLDPHGDLVDAVLGMIPQERREDVILLDPSDEGYSVGLNILAAHSDFERGLLASDLTSVFRRLSTSWGDQMESVLRNGILAFLESSRGGTLADLRRFLIDAGFRKEFLRTVTDPEIVYYWTKAFPQLSGGKSIGPLLTRLDEFLSRKPIRYMVSQSENRVDFAEILDRGRILLVKLPQGLIGRENTALLGSLITAKLQMAAMSRQRMPAAARRNFWCYMDEFQNFITPSMAEILEGARKYRLGLILAHHNLRQLEADRDVGSAVMSNCYTRVVFKVGDADARALENEFSHFEARDLMNLGTGNAVCRVERSDFDFNLAVPARPPEEEDEATRVREEVIAVSRAKYARSRSEIEAELRRQWETEEPEKKPARTPPPAAEQPKVSEAPPVSEPPKVSEKETPSAPAPPEKSTAPEPPAQAVVSESAPVSEAPRPVGMGRGGESHQLIVENLASEASRLGLRTTKECPVEGGRIDLVIQASGMRIAIEVAVNSNTAHEIENLQKCVESKMDVIVCVSPHENVRENIAKAARRTFDSETLARIRFEAPESLLKWIQELAKTEESIDPPDVPKSQIIAGRKVRTRHAELSPEESRKKEAEAMEVIADLLRKKRSKKDPDSK